MEDRFRFRVWNKKNKEMIYNAEIAYDGMNYNTSWQIGKNTNDGWVDCFGYYLDYPEDYEVMQCTGLKDKNGKLIYEGDILYNPFSNYKYVVNYGKFALNYTKPFSVNITGFYITYKENIKNEVDSLQMLDLNNIEVIGNVYQNPELLED